MLLSSFLLFFFSSRRRHTRCALVTGVQTCALPIYLTWLGVLAPQGTPNAIVQRLNAEINTILQDQKFKDTLATLGTNPMGGSSAAFDNMIKEDARMSATLIENAGRSEEQTSELQSTNAQLVSRLLLAKKKKK